MIRINFNKIYYFTSHMFLTRIKSITPQTEKLLPFTTLQNCNTELKDCEVRGC